MSLSPGILGSPSISACATSYEVHHAADHLRDVSASGALVGTEGAVGVAGQDAVELRLRDLIRCIGGKIVEARVVSSGRVFEGAPSCPNHHQGQLRPRDVGVAAEQPRVVAPEVTGGRRLLDVVERVGNAVAW